MCAPLLLLLLRLFRCLHSSSPSSHDDRTYHPDATTRISRIACSKRIKRQPHVNPPCLPSKLSLPHSPRPGLSPRFFVSFPFPPFPFTSARRCCSIAPIRDPTAFDPSTVSLPPLSLSGCVHHASIQTLASSHLSNRTSRPIRLQANNDNRGVCGCTALPQLLHRSIDASSLLLLAAPIPFFAVCFCSFVLLPIRAFCCFSTRVCCRSSLLDSFVTGNEQHTTAQ